MLRLYDLYGGVSNSKSVDIQTASADQDDTIGNARRSVVLKGDLGVSYMLPVPREVSSKCEGHGHHIRL